MTTTTASSLTPITPESLLTYASTVAIATRELLAASEAMNLQAGIDWPQREKIRSIHGHLDKIDDTLLELIDRIGTEDSEQFIRSFWLDGATLG